MDKISLSPTNDFCPQTLFLYGTCGDDGQPDFGLFCWFSYLWDEQLGAMACIGGEKLTKERIHKNRVFSANLVTEKLLPLADYFGNVDGHDPHKMDVDVSIERGRALNVPILADSPVVLELEATQFIPLDGGEVLLCKIHNVLQDASLSDSTRPIAERLAAIAPIRTTCQRYFSWSGADLGGWGEPGKTVR